MSEKARVIVLFDGVCNLCSDWVKFCLPRDRTGRLRYAALQDDAGQKLLKAHQLETVEFKSIVVVADGKVYQKSQAVFRIVEEMSWGWRVAGRIGAMFPRAFCNVIYDWVARNRYRWFGKSESCFFPNPEQRSRFLY